MADVKPRTKRRLDRWRKLHANKSQWLLHWEDLAYILLPRRLGFVTQMVEGERRTEEIYDGTPMRAARGLANAVGQLLRPEGEKWFLIRAEEDALNNSDEVVEWLKRAENKLLAAMFNSKARFRQASGESDTDLVVFGSAVMFTGLSDKGPRLKYLNIDLKDADIGLDDDGNVDTMFQRRWYTLRQAEQRFTKSRLSENLQSKFETQNEDQLDTKYEFLRVVTPRPNGNEEARLARNFPFTNDWIEVDTMHEISEGGFRGFPFVVPRWDTSSGEIYGRSPGMIALPDSETLNAMGETILVSGQKQAEPSVFAPNDSSFDAVNSFSGGITYYDVDTAVQLRGNPFFTLDQNFNLPITRDMQLDTRLQVEAAFFKNVFNLPVRGPEMTATEVIARKEEFVREVGAVFGRLESDYLGPIVERSFSILLRTGFFDPIPEVLINKDVRFEYTSPLKRIREQAEAAAARLWVQGLTELRDATGKPEVMDIVNADNIARFSARALDLPEGSANSEEEVAAIRAKREEEEAEMAERMKVAQEAEIASNAGRAAKDINEAFSDNQASDGEQQ